MLEEIKKLLRKYKFYFILVDIKESFMYFIGKILIYLNIIKLPYFKVLSREQTLNKIIDEGNSCLRIGEGEIRLICGESLGFQKFDVCLSNRLLDILKTNSNKLIICIPDYFDNQSQYKLKARIIFQKHLINYKSMYIKIFNKNNIYGNSYITRPYMDFKNVENTQLVFDLIKGIWKSKDILIIEGKFSRLGVNNDLFAGSKSIKRILCPSIDAFSKYKEILFQASQTKKNIMILVSLGPTAKLLVFDLFKLGYTAVDIGHIDIEYEWYIGKNKVKVPIKDKFVNEVGNNLSLNDLDDMEYKSQIITEIS